jgi:hypothetical protein
MHLRAPSPRRSLFTARFPQLDNFRSLAHRMRQHRPPFSFITNDTLDGEELHQILSIDTPW